MGGDRPLETGWLADTPADDNLVWRFVLNQRDLNALIAVSHPGGRAVEGDGVALADAAVPIAYYNQALLTRPLLDAGDPRMAEIEDFFAGTDRPHTLLSVWPTPDLSSRGWTRYGHPMFVARPPAPVPDEPVPEGVQTVVAATPEDLGTAERIMVEGYPIPEAEGAVGTLLPHELLGSNLRIRVGLVDGAPATVACGHIEHGLVNLCLAATLPAARRRGVWRRLVWDRVGDAPDLPAVAFTSDDSRPGFVKLGFFPMFRFTLWGRA